MLLVDLSMGLASRHANRLNPFAMARTVKVMVLSFAATLCVPEMLKYLARLAALSQILPSVADYVVQRVLRERRLRIGRDELKREYRDEQGDSFVKGRRRALHRAFNDPS